MTRKYHQDGERYRIKERKARWKIDPKQVNIQKRAEETRVDTIKYRVTKETIVSKERLGPMDEIVKRRIS